MGYVISIVSGVVSAMLVFILQSVIRENARLKRAKDEDQAKRDAALNDGMVCLLRKALMEEHELWIERKYITSHALENGLLMYAAYKALGGNGMIDHMKDEVESLPIKD